MSEWISVKDRLPEKTGSYLVNTDRGAVCCAHWYKSGFSGERLSKHITHWMPLPEAVEMSEWISVKDIKSLSNGKRYLFTGGKKTEEWISVKKRKPDVGTNILMYSKSGGRGEGEYCGGDSWIQYRWSTILHTGNVTHWMPMPPKPMEEQE